MILKYLVEGSNLSGLDDSAPESDVILMNIVEEINKYKVEKEETDFKKAELQKRLNTSELSLLKKHENYFGASPESESHGNVVTSNHCIISILCN